MRLEGRVAARLPATALRPRVRSRLEPEDGGGGAGRDKRRAVDSEVELEVLAGGESYAAAVMILGLSGLEEDLLVNLGSGVAHLVVRVAPPAHPQGQHVLSHRYRPLDPGPVFVAVVDLVVLGLGIALGIAEDIDEMIGRELRILHPIVVERDGEVVRGASREAGPIDVGHTEVSLLIDDLRSGAVGCRCGEVELRPLAINGPDRKGAADLPQEPGVERKSRVVAVHALVVGDGAGRVRYETRKIVVDVPEVVSGQVRRLGVLGPEAPDSQREPLGKPNRARDSVIDDLETNRGLDREESTGAPVGVREERALSLAVRLEIGELLTISGDRPSR